MMKQSPSLMILLIAAVIIIPATQAQSVYSGRATKFDSSNPTLSIHSAEGAPECIQALSAMLVASDWFTLRPNGTDAAIQLRAEARQDGADYLLMGQATLSGKGTHVALIGKGATAAQAAAAFVDDLLKQLYNVPAYCSRKIIFAVTGQRNLKELFSCHIDGSEFKRVTNNNAVSTEPSWGHAGAFVYTLNKANNLKIVLYDWKQNRQRIVSGAGGLNASPALSGNGRYIALPMSLNNQVDLYLLDLVRNKRVRLTEDRDVEASPAFSPDSRQLCYVSDKSGNPQIYLRAVNGNSRPVRLTKGRENVSPEWSPVSNMLCFSSRLPSGQYVISVMDMKNASAGGGTPQVVTNDSGNWEAPSWAPDGRHIVCTRNINRSQRLYLIDTWYYTVKPIGTIPSGVSLPSWQSAR